MIANNAVIQTSIGIVIYILTYKIPIKFDKCTYNYPEMYIKNSSTCKYVSHPSLNILTSQPFSVRTRCTHTHAAVSVLCVLVSLYEEQTSFRHFSEGFCVEYAWFSKQHYLTASLEKTVKTRGASHTANRESEIKHVHTALWSAVSKLRS